ncbi:hypothetical protein [Shimia ponticola]|uniref:hypothetical protein n=1 Tax=Shimia ponticola TaxID=2582893 RepID=UPI0011BE3A23|nr:hypothetical protein [Shimia ponticola]
MKRGALGAIGALCILTGLGFLTWVGFQSLADMYGIIPSGLIFGLSYLCLGLGLMVLAKPETRDDTSHERTPADDMTALITAFVDGLSKGRAARKPD